MIDELLPREETSWALVLTLSGTIAVLIAHGSGAVSLKRVVSGALSNPVPRPELANTLDTNVSFQTLPMRTTA